MLEQRGYVERVPDPTDGRAILIRRTPRGWEVNRIARHVVEQIQQEWAQALGQERFASLINTLRHLAVVLDEPVGATDPPEAPTPPKKKGSRVQEKKDDWRKDVSY